MDIIFDTLIENIFGITTGLIKSEAICDICRRTDVCCEYKKLDKYKLIDGEQQLDLIVIQIKMLKSIGEYQHCSIVKAIKSEETVYGGICNGCLQKYRISTKLRFSDRHSYIALFTDIDQGYFNVAFGYYEHINIKCTFCKYIRACARVCKLKRDERFEQLFDFMQDDASCPPYLSSTFDEIQHSSYGDICDNCLLEREIRPDAWVRARIYDD